MTVLDASVPEFAQWINPVLVALRELGGSGKPREVVELVAKNEEVSDTVLDRTITTGGSRFTNQVHWARYFLAEDGYIDRSRRGVWALTEKGSVSQSLSPAKLRKLVTEVQRREREAREVRLLTVPGSLIPLCGAVCGARDREGAGLGFHGRLTVPGSLIQL